MSAPDSISSYLRLYGSALGERVLSQFPPLHNPGDPVSPWLHQLKRRLSQLKLSRFSGL
jgi:hypothetical protein